ncbi:hypothetical protein Y032_0174g471 [Ancylostoma ceylanicum]|uniref:Uncharacterized protein n=1 Tax=Ancylostoma ceylanicum TaxID=53326 RepID=A0A016SV70_9BILA|nr:hypothetical protein Y032_0174g471 [Ancylostoma ceylanicum]
MTVANHKEMPSTCGGIAVDTDFSVAFLVSAPPAYTVSLMCASECDSRVEGLTNFKKALEEGQKTAPPVHGFLCTILVPDVNSTPLKASYNDKALTRTLPFVLPLRNGRECILSS